MLVHLWAFKPSMRCKELLWHPNLIFHSIIWHNQTRGLNKQTGKSRTLSLLDCTIRYIKDEVLQAHLYSLHVYGHCSSAIRSSLQCKQQVKKRNLEGSFRPAYTGDFCSHLSCDFCGDLRCNVGFFIARVNGPLVFCQCARCITAPYWFLIETNRCG